MTNSEAAAATLGALAMTDILYDLVGDRPRAACQVATAMLYATVRTERRLKGLSTCSSDVAAAAQSFLDEFTAEIALTAGASK